MSWPWSCRRGCPAGRKKRFQPWSGAVRIEPGLQTGVRAVVAQVTDLDHEIDVGVNDAVLADLIWLTATELMLLPVESVPTTAYRLLHRNSTLQPGPERTDKQTIHTIDKRAQWLVLKFKFSLLLLSIPIAI